MCLSNSMEFRHCLFKILKNQNVADGQRENSIPHSLCVCVGGGGGGGGGYNNTGA